MEEQPFIKEKPEKITRYQIHGTLAGERIYDYKKYDYVKNKDGSYFLVAYNEPNKYYQVEEKLNTLRRLPRAEGRG
jgi:hypothetical protein